MSLVSELFEAIDAGREARVREIVADQSTLAVTTDDRGVSAILNASFRRNDGVVQALVTAAPGLDLFEGTAGSAAA